MKRYDVVFLHVPTHATRTVQPFVRFVFKRFHIIVHTLHKASNKTTKYISRMTIGGARRAKMNRLLRRKCSR